VDIDNSVRSARSRFGADDFDAQSARRVWQLAELERAVLASLAQSHDSLSVLHELALGLERIAAPGTLASILVVDDAAPGILRHGAAASLPVAYVAQIDAQTWGPSAGSCGTAAWRRSRVIVQDIATDPLWDRYRDAALAAGLKACWSVPVLATDGDVLGTFAFYYRERRSPGADDLVTIDGAARLARIVLERERSERIRRRAIERDRALLAAARVLASEECVPPAMEQVLAALGDALSWPAGVVWLRADASAPLLRAAAWAVDPARFGAFLSDASRQPLLRASRCGLRGEPRLGASAQPFQLPLDEPLSPSVCPTAALAGIRQGVAIPIQTGDDTIGTIELFSTASEAIDAELEAALRSVGLQVGQFCRRARTQADRQRLIAELRETVRFSELFASILAHDLRNPLNTLSMGTQLLAKDAAPGAASILQRMQNSATRMSRMIEQLLDVTRSREGCGLALDRDSVLLGDLASASANELAIAYPDARIELSIEGDTSGHWDRDRLAQVLSNLIGNAIEHREGGSPVDVRVDGRDVDWVSLETRNLGSIAADALATLFDPFKPARPAAKRSRGLGLGLYITHVIVIAHGGSIDVRSDADGTRFLVQLPRSIDAETPEPRPITLPPPSEVRRGDGRAASLSNA
jgi:signal transduction histidine kinase